MFTGIVSLVRPLGPTLEKSNPNEWLGGKFVSSSSVPELTFRIPISLLHCEVRFGLPYNLGCSSFSNVKAKKGQRRIHSEEISLVSFVASGKPKRKTMDRQKVIYQTTSKRPG